MKAVVIHAARDLRVEEREPEEAGAGQVEVAVEAGGIYLCVPKTLSELMTMIAGSLSSCIAGFHQS